MRVDWMCLIWHHSKFAVLILKTRFIKWGAATDVYVYIF